MMVNANVLFDKRNEFMVKPADKVKVAALAATAVGFLTLAAGFYLESTSRVWGAFLFNLYFFFALGLGGSALGAIQDVVGALWGRPIRKVQEAFSYFLPIACGMMLFFLLCITFNFLGAADLYVWMKDPSMLDHFWGKNIWLQKTPFILRNVAWVVVVWLVWAWQMRQTRERDKLFMSGDFDKGVAQGKHVRDKLRFWSGPVLVVYGVAYTFLGFDFLMSLSPLWFSTLWGGWLFAVMMQTLMASILITLFIMKKTAIGDYIKRQQFHDVGKLMHGFTIFFAYLTYAHILTYWYGNVPEETEYFLHRMHAPWIYIVILAPIFAFVFPLFALLSKKSKWTARAAIPIAAIILLSQWSVYMLIVMPETGITKFGLPWLEVGGLVFFFGIFVSAIVYFMNKNVMLPIADPLLVEAYDDHH